MLSDKGQGLSYLERELAIKPGDELTQEQKSVLDSFQPIEYNGIKMILDERNGRLHNVNGAYIDLNESEHKLLSNNGDTTFGRIVIRTMVETNHPTIKEWYKK